MNARCLEDTLRAMAGGWLPGRWALIASPLDVCPIDSLFPVEAAAIEGAHPRRKSAFRGGRACARAALAKLGVPLTSIPRAASGAPLWPRGVVGSISHTDEMAVALVAHTPPVAGLGIDIEKDEPIDDATMLQLVCRPEELIDGCPPAHSANLRHGKLLFSIKEAVYKLYQPITATFLDFRDLRIYLDASGSFRAELVDPRLPKIMGSGEMDGRFSRTEGLLIALAVSPSQGAPLGI